jgi:hypothetical protein
VISLRRLLMDVRSHFHLLTRENYVCYDGLPYDYEPVMQRELIEKAGTGVFWGHTSGPNAWASSQMAHKQFDKLASIAPENRTRGDRLPLSLLAKIESWLDQSDAERFAKWSHAYLAHAGNPVRRQQIADLRVTNDKITETIRTLARACEALSAYVLYAGGRLNALMPTAQFDQFENLNKPAMRESSAESIHQLWYRLGAERDVFVESVCDELIT